jgi:hypothetical protein
VIAILAGVGLVLLTLWDAFETVILPRTVVRLLRLSRTINIVIWRPWSVLADRARSDGRRERYLSFYGPISVILMLAVWAMGLMSGFALVAYGLGSPCITPQRQVTFFDDLYVSGTTLFTLGLGDVVPASDLTRALLVVEAGTGLGFLTVGIAYLPVIYQSFSRREAQITLLDAWAGSPPSAVEMMRRCQPAVTEIHAFLRDWAMVRGDTRGSDLVSPSRLFSIAAWTAIVGLGAHCGARCLRRRADRRRGHSDLAGAPDVCDCPPRSRGSESSPHGRAQTKPAARNDVERSDYRDTRKRWLSLHARRRSQPPAGALAQDVRAARGGPVHWRWLPPWIRDGAIKDNWESSPRGGGSSITGSTGFCRFYSSADLFRKPSQGDEQVQFGAPGASSALTAALSISRADRCASTTSG